MRIVFKAIYIQNQEIVSFELNEPWQTCYDEGLKMDSRFSGNDKVDNGNDSLVSSDDGLENKKWLRTSKTTQQRATPMENSPASSACYWRPTAGRWPQYRRTMEEIIEAVAGLEWYK